VRRRLCRLGHLFVTNASGELAQDEPPCRRQEEDDDAPFRPWPPRQAMKPLTRLAIVGLTVTATAVLADRALTPVFRRRPERVMRPMRRLMRRLNTVYLGLSERLNLGPSVVIHTGRASGRVYTTPLCVSSVSGGFVVPAAFGTRADWFRNLSAHPSARLRHKGTTYLVEAEAIDAEEAWRLAGGKPGCDCWRELAIQDFMLLRPVI
jgi:deazaflavin-dependent oxidoreductase (nitroreductase family)